MMAADTISPELIAELDSLTEPEIPWQTVVWDDPVNLMEYVVYVFQSHFGFSSARAKELMLRVHNEGSAVVAEGSKEQMQLHVEAMHEYGLWATLRPAPEGD